MNLSRFDISLNVKILVMACCCVVLSAVLISYYALLKFTDELTPEMAKKSLFVGESVNEMIKKAVDYGVPFTELRGVDDFLAQVRKDNPEVLYVALSGPDGATLHSSGSPPKTLPTLLPGISQQVSKSGKVENRSEGNINLTSIPIVLKKEKLGVLHVGSDNELIKKKLLDILLDIVTVVVVSLLIAFELLLFLVTYTISAPVNALRDVFDRVRNGNFTQYLAIEFRDEFGRLNHAVNELVSRVNQGYDVLAKRYETLQGVIPEARLKRVNQFMAGLGERYQFGRVEHMPQTFVSRLEYIRWPFFLLIFSDSLSLSFFPLYVEELYRDIPGLSREMVIGLPISVFMLIWALSLPSAGVWSDRVGRRRSFLVGSVITCVGLVLSGTAQGILDLLLWRSITAVGYGIVFITAQGYITDNTTPQHRTKGMAMFLAGFFAGSLCGAAIGGILAERVGFRPTFFLSAFLSIASALFVYKFMHERRDAAAMAAAKPKLRLKDFGILFSNRNFVMITVFAAIPAKVALTGFLYYSAPIYLKSLGNAQSVIGRVMMAYGLMIIFLGPFVARLADALGNRKGFIIIGGYISVAAMLVIHYLNDITGVVISVALLGIAHAIGVSPQLTLVTEVCREDAKVVGVGTVMGIFRLIERIGNVTGPMIAGGLIAAYGFSGAFMGMAMISFLTITIFSLYLLFSGRGDKAAQNAGA